MTTEQENGYISEPIWFGVTLNIWYPLERRRKNVEGEVTFNPKVVLRTPDLNGRHVLSRGPTVTLIFGLQFLL